MMAESCPSVLAQRVGNTVFLEFPVERRFAYSKQLRGLQFIAIQLANRVQNCVPLQISERSNTGFSHTVPCASRDKSPVSFQPLLLQLRGQIAKVQHRPR